MAKQDSDHRLRLARGMLERLVRAGDPSAVETVLQQYHEIAQDETAVVDLVYNEYLIREETDDDVSFDEYLERFPKYRDRLERLFSIHATLSDEEAEGLTTADTVPATRRGSLTPTVGDVVGPFVLLSRLGEGGNGYVFRARQIDLDRIVALKILKNTATEEREIRRFLLEAKSAARLQHPNIVQVFESDVVKGYSYIALECVDGGTLEEKSSGHPIPSHDAATIMRDVASAMQFAHEQGIIHRDLKPGNVLLTSEGVPKVTDFGLAKRTFSDSSQELPTLTETGVVVGTPTYMSPEQAAGKNRQVGPATDVYGLGAILYQMLTGQPPFVGESLLDTLQNIQSLEPVAPSRLNPKIPKDLSTICLKCLEKIPEKRYATAASVSQDLDRFLTGRPIIARRSNLFQRLEKLARRNPVVTALSLGLVAALISVFTAISWQWSLAAEGQRTEATLRGAAEDALYAQQIALAHREYRACECERALEILRDTSPPRRHWEWDFLMQCCQSQELITSLGPDTRKCAVSPDGSWLAIVKGKWGTNAAGMLAVVDTRTNILHFRKIVDFGPALDVAFSPDSRTMATAHMQFKGNSGQIILWDTRSGEIKRSIPHPESGVFGVAFHPSQPILALACANHVVELHKVDGDQPYRQMNGHTDNVFRVMFHPDGRRLVSCSRDGTARIWSVPDGSPLQVLSGPNDIRNVAFTPDGRYVAANGYDSAIQIWDLRRQPAERTRVHLGGAEPLSYGLAVSATGRFFKAFGDGGRRLFSYDLAERQLVAQSANTSKRPFWLALHPHEDRLFLADADGNVLESFPNNGTNCRERFITHIVDFDVNDNGTVAVFAPGHTRAMTSLRDFRFRLVTRRGTLLQKHNFAGADDWGTAVALANDNRSFVGGCADGTLLRWTLEGADAVQRLTTDFGAIRRFVGPPEDGSARFVTQSGWLANWDWEENQISQKVRLTDSQIELARCDPTNSILAILDQSNTLRLFDLDSTEAGARNKLDLGSSEIRAIAIAPSGDRIAVVDAGQVRLLAIQDDTLQSIWQSNVPDKGTPGVAFHPDGKRLALSDGWVGRVILYDVDSGQQVLELDTRPSANTADVRFSKDGASLAAIVAGEYTLWMSNHSQDELIVQPAATTKSLDSVVADRKSDFHWHIDQACEAIFARLFAAARYHAEHALRISRDDPDRLASSESELETVIARLCLTKSLRELGRENPESDSMETLLANDLAEAADSNAVLLILSTFPGESLTAPSVLSRVAEKAVAQRPDDCYTLAVAAAVFVSQGNSERAGDLLSTAVPTSVSEESLIHFVGAVLADRQEQSDQAQVTFDQALQRFHSIRQPDRVLWIVQQWAASCLER